MIRGIEIKIIEITRRKPLCEKQISSDLKLTYSYINQIIREMISSELLKFELDKLDRRRKLLYPSKKGMIELKKEESKNEIIKFVDKQWEEVEKVAENIKKKFIKQ